MTYKVIEANNLIEFTNLVNQAILEGFIPQGGISTGSPESFIQAMTKV